MKKENRLFRGHSPFDDSAEVRLRRMGLLRKDDTPDQERMTALGEVLAGQFFDDLYDFHQDSGDAETALRDFLTEAETSTPRRRFLLICLQYDAIHRSLPDPVWWLSGNAQLASLFSDGFVGHLQKLSKEMAH